MNKYDIAIKIKYNYVKTSKIEHDKPFFKTIFLILIFCMVRLGGIFETILIFPIIIHDIAMLYMLRKKEEPNIVAFLALEIWT